MSENKPLAVEDFSLFLYVQNKIILFLILIVGSNAISFGQNQNSLSIDMKNSNPMSKEVVDSILNNNSICQKYGEVVKLDTLYWWRYPTLNLDSITRILGKTADELAEQSLDLKHSRYFSKQPFNLIGTYRETEMHNNVNTSNNIKTKVRVYDPGFVGKQLPKARTENIYSFYQSPNITPSLIDTWKISLGGSYSNLYYTLDYDFLRMYHVPFSDDLGGDRRSWTDSQRSHFSDVPDSFRYYRAFKKDSSVYIVLVFSRVYSMLDFFNKPNSSFKINIPEGEKPINSEFKYLLINLNSNAIEKTGYYRIDSVPHGNSSPSSPYSAISYETSYKRIGNQYYLDHVLINDYKFGPQINHISLSGISFQVDSVITEPSKVVKISESQADPRKINYLDYCISLDSKFRNNGNK